MNRLNIVTLGTKDIVKAYEFYKKLGFDTSIRGEEANPDIIFFKNEGTKIALFPLEELAKDVNKENPPSISNGFSFPGFTLAYNGKSNKEVDEIMSMAESAGAKIVKKPQKTDWGGYSGYFTDLDGYYWEVAYGECWEFDDSNMLIVKDEEK
ncbi:VOC family protein [Alkaliphilus pronyensis]|uniref:VOC family protein n=1 Tax=Alkaliphilus pronyensis TaxID=1482732 RepID=A0A6I0F5X7_9FIRM|nr:VOC family protein [Alkaliphilus pronyensis]KAB3537295.1 VOC family protein [Alkaliphilus pronyensis]